MPVPPGPTGDVTSQQILHGPRPMSVTTRSCSMRPSTCCGSPAEGRRVAWPGGGRCRRPFPPGPCVLDHRGQHVRPAATAGTRQRWLGTDQAEVRPAIDRPMASAFFLAGHIRNRALSVERSPTGSRRSFTRTVVGSAGCADCTIVGALPATSLSRAVGPGCSAAPDVAGGGIIEQLPTNRADRRSHRRRTQYRHRRTLSPLPRLPRRDRRMGDRGKDVRVERLASDE